MLGVFLLVAVAVAGLGFYQGWFHVSTTGADGKPSATITVDQDKIKADKEAAKEKVKDLEEKGNQKAAAATGKGKEGSPKP